MSCPAPASGAQPCSAQPEEEDTPGGASSAGQCSTSHVSITSTNMCRGDSHDSPTVRKDGVHCEVLGHSGYVQPVYGEGCGGVSGLSSGGVGYVVKDLTSMHDMQQSIAMIQPWSVTCGGESGLLCYAGGAV